ncbi:MAG: hypothetical protein AB3N64_02335 [Puniceicoccaceae bacterium]
MQLSRTPLVAALVAGWLVTPALEGQDMAGVSSAEPSIMERSPFIPPDFTPPGNSRAAAAKSVANSYEFKGFYRIGDKYRFLVSEPRSNDGDWVELGESSDSYEVRRFDPESETLTLFFNNSEKQLQLTELAANPTPMPVSGQIKTASAQQSQQGTPTPVRRTIRPTTRPGSSTSPTSTNSAPPPAWLEKLREEAAARRAQAIQGRSGVSGGVNASGSPDYSPPPPPDSPPPTPPPNLSEIDIPPPPTELPPPPPPEVMEKIQQSIRSGPPRG